MDETRTHLNTQLVNEKLQEFYHQLFDQALQTYNEKQKRKDRKIPNYYEKIRVGKQEKLFHEIVVQIGDKDNMNAKTRNGKFAEKILLRYYDEFVSRNHSLKVFSAHLHMDESTPHLHIDFVPVSYGNKRGLETKNSLKGALSELGFKGGTRSETEFMQWQENEKEHLAEIMLEYGIEWEQKDNQLDHLSVSEYKKKMRAEEAQQLAKKCETLDSTIETKTNEIAAAKAQLDNLDQKNKAALSTISSINKDSKWDLPEAGTLMTAKTYREKWAVPLVKKLKNKLAIITSSYYEVRDKYDSLWLENHDLKGKISELQPVVKTFRILEKMLGTEQIKDIVAQYESQREEAIRQRREQEKTKRKNKTKTNKKLNNLER